MTGCMGKEEQRSVQIISLFAAGGIKPIESWFEPPGWFLVVLFSRVPQEHIPQAERCCWAPLVWGFPRLLELTSCTSPGISYKRGVALFSWDSRLSATLS